MIARIFILFLALLSLIGCNPLPGLQLSMITIEVIGTCEEDVQDHTVRVWAIQEPDVKILVLADSVKLDLHETKELTFLSLENTYFQLVGSGDCRSTWEPVDIGKQGKQTLSYSNGISYLSIDISSIVGDERDSLRVNVTRVIRGDIDIELPGDESNHAISNISFDDLPIDSLELTTDGHYQIEVINFVNRIPRLIGQQTIHANVPLIALDF